MINITQDSSGEFWKKAAEALVSEIQKHDKSLVLLSGGSVIRLYPKLAEFIQVNKPNIALGQVDERFQPESRDSVNAFDIGRTNLWKVCEENHIPNFLISQEGTLEEAGSAYNEIIEKAFIEYEFKIGILGIGPDCHIAGLLPLFAKNWNTMNYVVGYENTGLYPKRISLTPKGLTELDLSIVVTGGEGKKEAIQNALNKKNMKNIDIYPAVVLQEMRKVELFTDIGL